MKRIFVLSFVTILGFAACHKQPSEAERKAEIERRVQDRLAAERRANERKHLAQRQSELEARLEAIAAERRNSKPAPTPATSPSAAGTETEGETGSYATFYRKLEPYGDWMETSAYGYVFQPHPAAQSPAWRPYTNGHWVYTDAGWTWISDERFGWATYHYGRWIRLRDVGWVWVPGDQWAPAWVSWRRGNDYVGWAPLPPEARFDRLTGIRNWADNYYDIGPGQYCFVPTNEFGRKVTPGEIVPPERNVTIINQTINVTNITYTNSSVVDRGLSYDDLRARSHQPIQRYRLERKQDLNSELPAIQGEVVTLLTADLHREGQPARPGRVARKIDQTVVERGWDRLPDAQAAQKAREKMNAEATPPPNLPPRQFVRPTNQVATLPAGEAVKSGGPPAAARNETSTERAGPSASPVSKTTGTHATPLAESVEPSSQESPSNPINTDQSDEKKATDQGERQDERAQRRAVREKKMLERRGQNKDAPEAKPKAAATGTMTPAPSRSPVASPTPVSQDKKSAAELRQERRERRARRAAERSPVSPSPSPETKQP